MPLGSQYNRADLATRAATAISSSFPAWALWLPLVAAAALGCDDTTGVYLHIEAVDVVADHLRVTATSAAGSVTRELDAGGGGTLRFPASLLAKFPAGVGAVGFVVVASRGGVDAATGSLAAARVPPHQVVDRTLRLGGGGGGGDGGMV